MLQPDDSLVAVGMTDGLLSMQRRKDDKQLASELEERKRRKHAMKRRFKFDTQMYSYKASKVSFLFRTYPIVSSLLNSYCAIDNT